SPAGDGWPATARPGHMRAPHPAARSVAARSRLARCARQPGSLRVFSGECLQECDTFSHDLQSGVTISDDLVLSGSVRLELADLLFQLSDTRLLRRLANPRLSLGHGAQCSGF